MMDLFDVKEDTYNVQTEYEKVVQAEKQVQENKGCVYCEKHTYCCGKVRVKDSPFCEEHYANTYFLNKIMSQKLSRSKCF